MCERGYVNLPGSFKVISPGSLDLMRVWHPAGLSDSQDVGSIMISDHSVTARDSLRPCLLFKKSMTTFGFLCPR